MKLHGNARTCPKSRRLFLDRLDHEPGEVVFRQPVTQVRRQKQRLVTVTGEEVLGACLGGPERPGRPGFVRQPPLEARLRSLTGVELPVRALRFRAKRPRDKP